MTTRQQLAAATSAAGGPPPSGPGIGTGPGAPSQIGPGGALVSGGPQYPPASGEPPYGRDYGRDRLVEREPRGAERPGLGLLGADRGPGPLNDRDRDRDRMDRDRERDRERERDRMDRERDRVPDSRDPKRPKSERIKSDRPGEYAFI